MAYHFISLGNPDRGKARSYGHWYWLEACAEGKSVRLNIASSLSTDLIEAQDSYVLGKSERKIQKADLLIINEMRYANFHWYQSELHFKVVADHSERGSIIVLPFSEWASLFEITEMVVA